MNKMLSFYFIFYLFLVPLILFAKSVDMWTSTENSEKIISVISSPKTVNCVKEAVFLLHVFFLSFKVLKKSVDRWSSNKNSEKKIVSASCIFLFISVGHVNKRSLSISGSFCYVPFTILTQKVWTGGQVMKILWISLFLFTQYHLKF